MRFLFPVILAVAALCASQATAEKVEVKGPHICCKQCVKIVGGILAKVDGVSDASCSIPDKTIAFTAKDEKAAKAGLKAILDGGFFGSATCDGKDLKVTVAGAQKGKANTVTITDVHVCCGMCVTAVKGAVKTATFEGKGPQKTVIVSGTDLNPADVLDSLRKAGFNGKVQK
jgi:copper chaperone CopZ